MFLSFLVRYPEEGLMGHMVTILNFLRDCYIVFHSGCKFTSLPTVNEGSFFSTTSPTLVDNIHSNRCEVVSHCSFDLHFPDS